MKERIIDFIKEHMNTIAVIIGLLLIIYFGAKSQRLSNELTTLKSSIAVVEEMNKLDSKLADMKKREAELYPMLQQKENELMSTLNELDIKKKQLDKIKKEKIKYEVDKMDVQSVSTLLTELGYTNNVISK